MNNLAFCFAQALPDGELGTRSGGRASLFLAGRLPRDAGPHDEPRAAVPGPRRCRSGCSAQPSRRASRPSCPARSRRTPTTGRPACGFACPPAGSNNPFLGDGKTVHPWRIRHGYDVAVLQPAHGERLELPAERGRRGTTSQNVYPNLLPVGGAPVFNPLARFTNSPEDRPEPQQRLLSLGVQSELGRSCSRSDTRAAGATNGINQVLTNPAFLTAGASRLGPATRTPTPSPACRRGGSTRRSARGR